MLSSHRVHCPGNQRNQGKVRKMKKVEMVREKSGNLRKKEESQGKVMEFRQFVLTLKFTTPQFQLDDLSFCQNAISRSHGKFSKVREESGKVKFETGGRPVTYNWE